MTKELGPCPVRGVREVLDRPLNLVVPARSGLSGRLHEEGQAGVGVSVADHVVGEEASERASSCDRTTT